VRKKGNSTILAVDDNSSLLALVKEVLTPLGYNLLVAASGAEALQLAAATEEKIDLLLTDVVMPEMPGHELAALFKARYPDIRILFMSGYICPAAADKLMLPRERVFIQKPFTPRTLISKTKKMLGACRKTPNLLQNREDRPKFPPIFVK